MNTMQELTRFFRALGDETRLQLVALLARQEPGRVLCVGGLAHRLGVTTSAVSQHLRVLKDLGLVHGERRGYRIHYYLDQERLATYQVLAREQLGEGFVPRRPSPIPDEEVKPCAAMTSPGAPARRSPNRRSACRSKSGSVTVR